MFSLIDLNDLERKGLFFNQLNSHQSSYNFLYNFLDFHKTKTPSSFSKMGSCWTASWTSLSIRDCRQQKSHKNDEQFKT